MKDTCIFLFDVSGIMALPWLNAGFECWCVDLQHPPGITRDGNLFKVNADLSTTWTSPVPKERIAFTASFPPCDHLAVSGARWFKGKGLRKLSSSIDCFATAAELADWSEAPSFIENPVSTISTYWRKPDFNFHPHGFTGWCKKDNYTKKNLHLDGQRFHHATGVQGTGPPQARRPDTQSSTIRGPVQLPQCHPAGLCPCRVQCQLPPRCLVIPSSTPITQSVTSALTYPQQRTIITSHDIMNTLRTAAELAEIRQNYIASSGLYTVWNNLSPERQQEHIKVMDHVLNSFLESIDGMPSVDELQSVGFTTNVHVTRPLIEAIRNLMLAAHMKQMSAVAALPEKWRKDQESAQSLVTVRGCAYELEKALGSVPAETPPTPVPVIPEELTPQPAPQKLKIGDVVCLKSGGPLMTVETCGTDGPNVGCIWFDGATIKQFPFHEDCLTLA